MRFYEQYKNLPKRPDYQNKDVIEGLVEIVSSCYDYLSETEKLDLISAVEGKTYFAFEKNGKHTRAVNQNLFLLDKNIVIDQFRHLLTNPFSARLNSQTITEVIYSSAMSFC